ncbi:CobW family GTP-binding protein [Marinibacterium profundimaris]|uniref:CobW C-terminal domain-containing protein n=1 Tax=Marinibacterium profundimaris TaxID=1679460 RepID=A0A225NPW7_9RHOB|nr:GTP-binding protein [Marinibacterium profundimaris]OWU74821.1 hypothetical protein ATO3_09510 [Marinibacterium profundimaris]
MDLPVTIIGGYLGAGKTTLINHLLRHNEGLRLAILVNEFGELPIDADLIEAEDGGLMSISGGCVCCAYGSDMIGVLEDIAAMEPRPDHVLLEASGVALPASIAVTVGMMQGFRSDGVIVLADAEQIRKTAANSYLADTVDRQIEQADLLLLTKADLVPDKALEEVTAWLSAKAPATRVLPVSRGELPVRAVVGAVPFPQRGGPSPATGHARFDSVLLEPSGPVDAEALARALAAEPSVTRAKGFVQTGDGLALIHVVGQRGAVEAVSGERRVGIICIGLRGELDAPALHALVAPRTTA